MGKHGENTAATETRVQIPLGPPALTLFQKASVPKWCLMNIEKVTGERSNLRLLLHRGCYRLFNQGCHDGIPFPVWMNSIIAQFLPQITTVIYHR